MPLEQRVTAAANIKTAYASGPPQTNRSIFDSRAMKSPRLANRDAPDHCGYNASRLTGNDRIHEEFLQLLAQRKPRTQGGRPLY